MLRGSTFLLQKSVKAFENVLYTIAESDKRLWLIDADNYSEENINLLLQFRSSLVHSLNSIGWPSDILTTKIMLGVFGNTPAFDGRFKSGFGVSNFGRTALEGLVNFTKTRNKSLRKTELRPLTSQLENRQTEFTLAQK